MKTTSRLKNLIFNDKPEAQVLNWAKRLAIVRPLSPYPRRVEEEDWKRRPLASYVREAIWRYFYERGREVPFEIAWHAGLTLSLKLGNELSRSIFVDGCYEPNEFCLLDGILRPGMNMIDVGAHEGLYSVFAARRVTETGHVWSVEPSSRERDTLERNIEINQLGNVTVAPVAAGERDAEVELKIAHSARSGHNTLGAPVWQDVVVSSVEPVAMRKLDTITAEMGINRLDALKIDAEGAELRIIQGASETLSCLRPILIFEAQVNTLSEQGASLDELLELVRSHRYRICSFDPDTGLPTAEPGGSDLNLAAFPVERPLP